MRTATFNPLSFGKPKEVLAILAEGADLTLTSDQEKALLAIIRSLPAGASIRDFMEECDRQAASELRISRETLEALRPLLLALASARF
jgi:hypothetical protein